MIAAIYGAGFLLVLTIYRHEGWTTALIFAATWFLWFPVMFAILSAIALVGVKSRW